MNLIIERLFIAVLLLSISGFVCCIIFLPLEKLAYRFSSAKTMVFVNTAALISFVIPFYFVASIVDRSEYAFQNYTLLLFADGSLSESFAAKVREFGFVEYLSLIWLLGTVLFLGFHIWRYISLSNRVMKNKFSIEDGVWAKVFRRLQEESRCIDLRLIGSGRISTPCTIGMRKRYIVIPANMLSSFDEDEVGFILRHEIYHAIHHDLQRNFLITILNCLNWFNPLYYFLRNNLSDWMEAACDEEVTRELDREQRRKYCELILKILELEQSADGNGGFVIGFSGANVSSRKKRMAYVMQKARSADLFAKVVIVASTGFSILLGNAVAKEADVFINQIFSRNVHVVMTEDIEIIDDMDFSEIEDFPYTAPSAESVYTEFQLNNTADKTYEIIYGGEPPIIGNELAGTEHTHILSDMNIKEHISSEDGSCITTQFEGRICTVCESVWKGNRIQTVEYMKCSHTAE